MTSFVRLDVPEPYVAVVTLDRPPVNALNRDIREQLLHTFDALQDREDVRAIVLTATGRLFCAGADIKEKDSLGSSQEQGAYQRANRLTRDCFFALLDSSKPVVAAVNGGALGAGFVLAACCDMIFAARSSFFAMPEIDVGLGGGASFLRRILPPAKVRRLTLTGERVAPEELHRLGAVEAVVDDGDLLREACAVARVIAAKSPTAVRTIRGSYLTVEALDLREGFRLEQEYTSELSKTPDAEEARRAFIEKRPPSF